ncbi:hypothetical protein Tco_1493715 [Tanacetum coccineum]
MVMGHTTAVAEAEAEVVHPHTFIEDLDELSTLLQVHLVAEQSEFVRMAARFGATIIPFGACGEDDYAQDIKHYFLAGSRVFKMFQLPVNDNQYLNVSRVEDYKLYWREQSEFVRMTARFGATVIPFGACGEDDYAQDVHEEIREFKRCRNTPCPEHQILRYDRSELPRYRQTWKEKRDGGVFNRLRGKEKNVSAHSESRYQSSLSRRTKPLSGSKDSGGGHWKSRSKKQKSSIEEDDMSQP